jgi:hypothetical protein
MEENTPLRTWILDANAAREIVREDNWLKMKSFLKKTGSNRLLHAQTLRVLFKGGERHPLRHCATPLPVGYEPYVSL